MSDKPAKARGAPHKHPILKLEPTDEQWSVDQRVRVRNAAMESEAAARWYADEWSEESILTRRHGDVAWPIGAALAPPSHRLIACVASLIEEGWPRSNASRQRREHASKILFIHRLLTDPDFEYGEDAYQGGVGSREWGCGLLRSGRGREPEGPVEKEWYDLVRKALRDLDAMAPDRGAKTAQDVQSPSDLALPSDLEECIADNTEIGKTLGGLGRWVTTRESLVGGLALGGKPWTRLRALRPFLGGPVWGMERVAYYRVEDLIGAIRSAAPSGWWNGKSQPEDMGVTGRFARQIKPSDWKPDWADRAKHRPDPVE